MEIIKELLTA